MHVSFYDTKTVRITWENRDTEIRWDEACIYAVENFGLPGHRYECHATAEWMDFEFTDSKDALIFSMGVQ